MGRFVYLVNKLILLRMHRIRYLRLFVLSLFATANLSDTVVIWYELVTGLDKKNFGAIWSANKDFLCEGT